MSIAGERCDERCRQGLGFSWVRVEVQACTKGSYSPMCEYWLGYSVYEEDSQNILLSKNKKG